MRAAGQDHAEMPAQPGGPLVWLPCARRQRGRELPRSSSTGWRRFWPAAARDQRRPCRSAVAA